MPQLIDREHARAAYDELAPAYDAFTAHHDYEAWTTTLEGLARAHGLCGRRLLDVACGTGKSFLPFLARGYEVTACDVSEEMAALAAQKVGEAARVEVHDMRALPQLGSFDLVCCIDDALNYLLTEDELRSALEGLRRNLADDGVVVFDVNTVRSYRTFYGSLTVVPGEERVLLWDGHETDDFGERDLAACTLEIVERRDDGTWERLRTLHHQRHHPRPVIEAALRDAGLDCVGVYGMQLDGSCAEGFREDGNSKAVYIARHLAPRGERG